MSAVEPDVSPLQPIFVLDNTFFFDAFKSNYGGIEGLYQQTAKLLQDYLIFKSATTGGAKLTITTKQVFDLCHHNLGKSSYQLDLALDAFIHVVNIGKPEQTIHHKESVFILADILGTEFSGRLNVVLVSNRDKIKQNALLFYHPDPDTEKPKMTLDKFNPPYQILNTDGVIAYLYALDYQNIKLVSDLSKREL